MKDATAGSPAPRILVGPARRTRRHDRDRVPAGRPAIGGGGSITAGRRAGSGSGGQAGEDAELTFPSPRQEEAYRPP